MDRGALGRVSGSTEEAVPGQGSPRREPCGSAPARAALGAERSGESRFCRSRVRAGSAQHRELLPAGLGARPRYPPREPAPRCEVSYKTKLTQQSL